MNNTDGETQAERGKREGARGGEERSCAEAEPLYASARRVEQTATATKTHSPLSYMHSHTHTTRTQPPPPPPLLPPLPPPPPPSPHTYTHTHTQCDGCQAQWEASRQGESLRRKERDCRGGREEKRREFGGGTLWIRRDFPLCECASG